MCVCVVCVTCQVMMTHLWFASPVVCVNLTQVTVGGLLYCISISLATDYVKNQVPRADKNG